MSTTNGSPIRLFLGVGLLMFLTQFMFEPAGHLSNKLLSVLQAPLIASVFDALTICICWIVFPVFVLFFFFQSFVVRPNFVQNASNVFFLALSVFAVQLGRLAFGEYRPFMLALFSEQEDVKPRFCEPGFGMPSAYAFLSVAFYHLFKRNFFAKQTSSKDYPRFLDERAPHFIIGLMSNRDERAGEDLVYGDFEHTILGQNFTLTAFRVIGSTLLILICAARFFSASNFLLQLVFSLALSAFWSRFYFRHCEAPIKGLVHDLTRAPTSRPRSLRRFNVITFGLFGLVLILYTARKCADNGTERKIIIDDLTKNGKCFGAIMSPEDLSLYYSMALFLPFFCVNLLRFMEERVEVFKVEPPKQDYFDLKNSHKLARTVLFFIPTIFLALLNYFTDSLISHATGFIVVHCILLLCYLLLFSVGVWLALPIAYLKFGILLKKEYPLTKDRKNSDRNDSDMTLELSEDRIDFSDNKKTAEWENNTEATIPETKDEVVIVSRPETVQKKTEKPEVFIPRVPKEQNEALENQTKNINVLNFKKVSPEQSDSGDSNGEKNGEEFQFVDSPEPDSRKSGPDTPSP